MSKYALGQESLIALLAVLFASSKFPGQRVEASVPA